MPSPTPQTASYISLKNRFSDQLYCVFFWEKQLRLSEPTPETMCFFENTLCFFKQPRVTSRSTIPLYFCKLRLIFGFLLNIRFSTGKIVISPAKSGVRGQFASLLSDLGIIRSTSPKITFQPLKLSHELKYSSDVVFLHFYRYISINTLQI